MYCMDLYCCNGGHSDSLPIMFNVYTQPAAALYLESIESACTKPFLSDAAPTPLYSGVFRKLANARRTQYIPLAVFLLATSLYHHTCSTAAGGRVYCRHFWGDYLQVHTWRVGCPLKPLQSIAIGRGTCGTVFDLLKTCRCSDVYTA